MLILLKSLILSCFSRRVSSSFGYILTLGDFRDVLVVDKVDGRLREAFVCIVGTGSKFQFNVFHFPSIINSSLKCLIQIAEF